jgi:hypothetical protein
MQPTLYSRFLGCLGLSLVWGRTSSPEILLATWQDDWPAGVRITNPHRHLAVDQWPHWVILALWEHDCPSIFQNQLAQAEADWSWGLAVWQNLLSLILRNRLESQHLADLFQSSDSSLLPDFAPAWAGVWLAAIAQLWTLRPSLQHLKTEFQQRLPVSLPSHSPLIDLGLALYLWGDTPQHPYLIQGRARKILSPPFWLWSGALTGAYLGSQALEYALRQPEVRDTMETTPRKFYQALEIFSQHFYQVWQGALTPARPRMGRGLPLTAASAVIQARSGLKLISQCE